MKKLLYILLFLPVLLTAQNRTVKNIIVKDSAKIGTGDIISISDAGDTAYIKSVNPVNIEINDVNFLHMPASTTNTSLGYSSGNQITTGALRNVFLGSAAGSSITTGDDNIFIGSSAGFTQTTATDNIFIGSAAGFLNSSGTKNINVGWNSGSYNSTGSRNTYFGYNTGLFNETGSGNIAVGENALEGTPSNSFSDNIGIGNQTGLSLTTGSDNVLIGNLAGSTLTTESNLLYIENSNSATPLIKGYFDRDILKIHGDLDLFYKTFVNDDFTYQNSFTEADHPWILNQATTGLDPAIPATQQEGGVIVLNTSSGAAGSASQMVYAVPVQADGGGLVFETRLHINTALGTSRNICVGFTDVSTYENPISIGGADVITTTTSDACMFVYAGFATTLEWFAVGVQADVDATGNGAVGTAPVADTYQTLRIEVASDGETATFYIDDTLVKTLTANVLTSNINLYATVVITDVDDAAYSVDVDYIYVGVNR